ncbi:MAG TPA: hypothetical protein VM492_13775, partial [Sumerlaeia bacterium]|nr:hypothetical protein [Sumerlaeia bacterium]
PLAGARRGSSPPVRTLPKRLRKMAKETFRIRIKRDGTIHLLSRQLGEERMRLLREMIEDSLGAVSEVRAVEDDDGGGPSVGIVDEERQERIRRGR